MDQGIKTPKDAVIALLACQEELANLARFALAYESIFPDDSDRKTVTTIQKRLDSILNLQPPEE